MALLKPRSFKIERFRDGDIIVSDGKVGIFSSLGHAPDEGSFNDSSYFFVSAWCWLFDPGDDYLEVDGFITNLDGAARRAKKSERNYLFRIIIKNGYKIEMLRYV